MVEETVYDEVVTCDHSYDKRCHTSYVTQYQAQQEEECEENYRKVCLIDYEDLAYNSTVEICTTNLVKDCDVPGEPVCQTVYQASCATRQVEHEVRLGILPQVSHARLIRKLHQPTKQFFLHFF